MTRRSTALVATTALLAVLAPVTWQHRALAATKDPCGSPVDIIACENTKPGSPESEWRVYPSEVINGFTTQVSVNVGEPVHFKVRTEHDYVIEIYRLGWYQGNGARKVATITPSLAVPQNLQECVGDTSTGLIDCGNWAVSATWNMPADAVSGLYLADLRAIGVNEESQVPFVVRDDGRSSKMVFQTADTTWQAYNRWGGNSTYYGQPAGRAYKVSYNRPYLGYGDDNSWLNAEYPMIRWLERNGYDVSYMTGVDTDRSGHLLAKHDVFLSVGHDEYWSGAQRANVEAAADAGMHLAFFSGNEMFWKIRWEAAIDGSGTPYRTLVCYKETKANAKIDPSPEWTGTWRDPRFSPPSDGGRPENELIGQIFTVNGRRNDSITVPASYGRNRLWRSTSVATLAPGEVATFPAGTLGYEWDSDLDNGFRPAGSIRLSETNIYIDDGKLLKDYGNTFGNGPASHHLTMHRRSSGALVFGAGTVQWSWGLDSNHNFPAATADSRVQQATVNLFADMGAQPTTLQGDLVPATASSDLLGPDAAVTSPTGTTTVTVGSPATITGTASDAGGVVAGVEVSLDGGTRWHPAVGLDTWQYVWTPRVSGAASIKVRATDDSANIGPVTTSAITVQRRDCPCSIWSDTDVPEVKATNDTRAIELGVKFRATSDGFVSGVRFYKGEGNTGTHTGSLWSSAGQLLGTATFSNETAVGWQKVLFEAPVGVTKETTYVASYHTDSGRYAASTQYFGASPMVMEPLTALKSTDAGGNGVYRLGASAFPTQTFNATNYWVDVVYQDDESPSLVNRSPIPNAGTVPLSTPVTATFNKPLDQASLVFTLDAPDGSSVPAAVTLDSSATTATLTPSSDLAQGSTYTATISAADTEGHAMAQPATWTFITGVHQGPPGLCPCTLFSDFDVPAVPETSDAKGVELGMRFTPDTGGVVSAVRFYKGRGNTGVHTVNVWSGGGVLLASAVSGTETASGWQTVQLPSPAEVVSEQDYVVSYHTTSGRYAVSGGFFKTTGKTYGPLTAAATSSAAPNGVYRYGASSAFPSSTYNGNNYWVDVVFEDTSPPHASSTSPIANAGTVLLDTTVSATFNKVVDPSTVSLSLTDPAGSAVAGAVSFDESSRTATLVPSAPLAEASTYTGTATATDVGGRRGTSTWTFTTGARQALPGQCPCTLWSDFTRPATESVNEGKPVELGVKFRTSSAGVIKGVRFFKGPSNTGTHTGSIWSATGTQLATGTFVNESASGWQTLLFGTPLQVAANTTYVASYHTSTGRFAHTSGYFSTSSFAYGPLTALRSGLDGKNGVYAYGPGGFPSNSYNASNYWVDVVFTTSP